MLGHLAKRLDGSARANLRILLIASSAAPGCPVEWQVGDDREIAVGHAPGGLKNEFRTEHFIKFRQWLEGLPTDGTPAQVFLVASAAEPEMVLLCDLLARLRSYPDKFGSLIGIFTLLASHVDGDTALYGALREIGRFTFAGPHVAEEWPDFRPHLIRQSLLDDIIFCGRQDAAEDGTSAGLQLSEALYALSNTCSGLLLRTELNLQKVLRGVNIQWHAAVAHTLGVLTVPIDGTPAALHMAARSLAGVPQLKLSHGCIDADSFRLLIASDAVTSTACINTVFPFGAAAVITPDCGVPGLLGALHLQCNIPLAKFDEVWAANLNYVFGTAHSCRQELHAQQYEQRLPVAGGAPHGALRRELPAELTMALAELKWSTIFCQSLICGLVHEGGDPACWFVDAIADFGRQILTVPGNGNRNLLGAFQSFTVFLPYASNTAGNWLHSNTRDDYMRALHEAARAIRLGPGFSAVQKEFSQQIAEWRSAGTDVLLGEYLDMLQLELLHPVWVGW